MNEVVKEQSEGNVPKKNKAKQMRGSKKKQRQMKVREKTAK